MEPSHPHIGDAVQVASQFAADGGCFVGDTNNHAIRAVAADGTTTTVAGGSGGATCYGFAGSCGVIGYADGPASVALFNQPRGLAADIRGRAYIADAGNRRVRMLFRGAVYTVAGGGGLGRVPGVGSNAQFNSPWGLALASAAGNSVLYMADQGAHTIYAIALNAFAADDDTVAVAPYGAGSIGVATFFAGGFTSGSAGRVNGVGTNALFSSPRGIAVDATSVFVADTTNNLIRQINRATAAVTTLAGGRGSNIAGFADGIGSNALFNSPYGVAVDAAGRLDAALRASGVRTGEGRRWRARAPAGELTIDKIQRHHPAHAP